MTASHSFQSLCKPLLASIWLSLAAVALADDSGVILLYHHVDSSTPPSTSISPADFRAHLQYLQDNEFSVLRLDDLVERLRAGEEVPARSVSITFDDGYISIYETAFPMLQEFGMPFTVFLSTEPIDNAQNNYMSWDQITQMSDAGVQIANHMVSHPYMLDRLGNESDSQWLARQRDELLQAEQTILEHTGQNHRYLAYPYGEFNLALKELLAEEGFTGFAQNSGAFNRTSDFLALPRYPLASIYANLETASTKLQSLAFNVELVEPLSPVTSEVSPPVSLRFAQGDYNVAQISCFANSQALTMNWLDQDNGLLRLEPKEEFTGRRWRYICTAPDPGSDRYFWYSVQWINPAR